MTKRIFIGLGEMAIITAMMFAVNALLGLLIVFAMWIGGQQ